MGIYDVLTDIESLRRELRQAAAGPARNPYQLVEYLLRLDELMLALAREIANEA